MNILDQGFVNEFTHNNDDLTVVNAARVSMGKRVDKIVLAGTPEAEEREQQTGMKPDDGLINYLARERHWTPFGQVRFRFDLCLDTDPYEMIWWLGNPEKAAGFVVEHYTSHEFCISGSLWGWVRNPPPLGEDILDRMYAGMESRAFYSMRALLGRFTSVKYEDIIYPESDRFSITLHLRWPIFVARQAMRHNIGVVWNEVSRRYVTEEPKFYKPKVWRGKAESVKQGSSDDPVYFIARARDHQAVGSNPSDRMTLADLHRYSVFADEWYEEARHRWEIQYLDLRLSGVCPEQARIILPQSLYTECIATFTRPALARFCRQRCHPHAQWEIRQYAQAMREIGVAKWGDKFETECQ